MFPGKLKMLILQTLWIWICIHRWLTRIWFIKQVKKLIKVLLPRDVEIQHRDRKAQFNQTYLITKFFPLKSRTKYGAISVTRASWYYQWCLRWNCPFQEKYFQCTTGKSGKAFIEELAFWIKQFNSNSDLNSVALKAFMVLPTLILQKLSATSKGKEHSSAIERRLNLWRQGDLDLLLKEVRFIQGKSVNSKKARTVEDISKVLGKLVFQGKLSAAIFSFWIARAQQAYSTLHQKS